NSPPASVPSTPSPPANSSLVCPEPRRAPFKRRGERRVTIQHLRCSPPTTTRNLGVRVKLVKLPRGAPNENDKETMGGGSCTASADSRGFDARGSAVQLHQSRNCRGSSELRSQLPPAQPAEAISDV